MQVTISALRLLIVHRNAMSYHITLLQSLLSLFYYYYDSL